MVCSARSVIAPSHVASLSVGWLATIPKFFDRLNVQGLACQLLINVPGSTIWTVLNCRTCRGPISSVRWTRWASVRKRNARLNEVAKIKTRQARDLHLGHPSGDVAQVLWQELFHLRGPTTSEQWAGANDVVQNTSVKTAAEIVAICTDRAAAAANKDARFHLRQLLVTLVLTRSRRVSWSTPLCYILTRRLNWVRTPSCHKPKRSWHTPGVCTK